jgi:hypothetical protein
MIFVAALGGAALAGGRHMAASGRGKPGSGQPRDGGGDVGAEKAHPGQRTAICPPSASPLLVRLQGRSMCRNSVIV